ncbi:hypothetical protein [Vagococcus xieshaowenii]|uniref:Uncharacterized protein n=1 Tax=Vagococcus xieshaowenii TaxID=2562451 RepID=A0AAJ5EFN7_9ENTE|nr:hypothetical protein [Vagococcus xieshaowenii]QCA28525.1 hypothetical protein E4Z98_04045 [Vagococcus xieshaowenii]TFZ42722.1 hypothetical protein E4031_01695 [Vagococcus xieshaowenii]
MTGIRRLFFIFFTLLTGIFLGAFGLKLALIISIPLFATLIILWDEKKYETRQQHVTYYQHHYYEDY